MYARVIGWLCGLNLLLLTLDTASQFLYAAAALENQPPVHLAHTHCASCRRSYNEANPMGALDVVADHADMAMDEGEANVTSWRTVVPQLKAQVAVNTQAIEVRVCLNASISALRLSDADPPGLSASPQELRAQLDALEASTTGGEHHRVGHGSEQRGGDGKGGDGKGDGKGGDGRGDGKGGDGKGDGKGDVLLPPGAAAADADAKKRIAAAGLKNDKGPAGTRKKSATR